MYALVNNCGNEYRIQAVSEDKTLLREILVKRAKKYVKDYFLGEDGGGADTVSRERGRQMLEHLKYGFNGDYWDDEDDAYLMSWEIVKVPLAGRKHEPVTVKMAFGNGITRALEDVESPEDVRRLLGEYLETDALVIRKFRTKAERKAYLQGIQDCYGWDKFIDICQEYPRIAKQIP